MIAVPIPNDTKGGISVRYLQSTIRADEGVDRSIYSIEVQAVFIFRLLFSPRTSITSKFKDHIKHRQHKDLKILEVLLKRLIFKRC